MFFDSHMHTKFSSDSKMQIEDVIKQGQALNIGTILTEHMDYNYPKEDLFKFDPNKFFNEYSKYRGDNLLLGVEIGLSSSSLSKNNDLSTSYPFDFILGSIHSVNDVDIFTDESKNDLTKTEYLTLYFKEMIKDIKEFDNFDSLSHIDYPCRYLKGKDKSINLSELGEYVDEVFKILIEKEKCLEINTKKFDDKNFIYSIFNLCKRYKDLGGKYVTVGSDAHNKDRIGKDFNIAKDIILEANLTPVYFSKRKIKIINL